MNALASLAIFVSPPVIFCMNIRGFVRIKAGENRGRAPGQASDNALRAPNPLGSSTMTRCFIEISGPQTSPGPRDFAPLCPPLSPALVRIQYYYYHRDLTEIITWCQV